MNTDKIYAEQLANEYAPKDTSKVILYGYGVPEQDRHYIMTFYICGIMAIVMEWLREDCEDSVDYIIKMIQQCVKHCKEEE